MIKIFYLFLKYFSLHNNIVRLQSPPASHPHIGTFAHMHILPYHRSSSRLFRRSRSAMRSEGSISTVLISVNRRVVLIS